MTLANADEKYTGVEPDFYEGETTRDKIMQGLNYYAYHKNVKDAKKKAKQNSIYKKKKMHIDGIQEVNNIDGYRINLTWDDSSDDTVNYGYDDVKTLK